MNRHVLSILVQNHTGVLSRIAGLFSRRGYSIDSISVGLTDEDFSRITIVTRGDDMIIDQITKQLEKLHQVVKVIKLSTDAAVFRELALIKVNALAEKRSEIVSMAEIFRASVIDVSHDSMTIEMTGTQSKIDAFTELLKPYGVKEAVRTGLTGLERGNITIKDYINLEEE